MAESVARALHLFGRLRASRRNSTTSLSRSSPRARLPGARTAASTVRSSTAQRCSTRRKTGSPPGGGGSSGASHARALACRKAACCSGCARRPPRPAAAEAGRGGHRARWSARCPHGAARRRTRAAARRAPCACTACAAAAAARGAARPRRGRRPRRPSRRRAGRDAAAQLAELRLQLVRVLRRRRVDGHRDGHREAGRRHYSHAELFGPVASRRGVHRPNFVFGPFLATHGNNTTQLVHASPRCSQKAHRAAPREEAPRAAWVIAAPRASRLAPLAA